MCRNGSTGLEVSAGSAFAFAKPAEPICSRLIIGLHGQTAKESIRAQAEDFTKVQGKEFNRSSRA
ncbi:hypothetical protein D3C79_1027310 [compost metagenome]